MHEVEPQRDALAATKGQTAVTFDTPGLCVVKAPFDPVAELGEEKSQDGLPVEKNDFVLVARVFQDPELTEMAKRSRMAFARHERWRNDDRRAGWVPEDILAEVTVAKQEHPIRRVRQALNLDMIKRADHGDYSKFFIAAKPDARLLIYQQVEGTERQVHDFLHLLMPNEAAFKDWASKVAQKIGGGEKSKPIHLAWVHHLHPETGETAAMGIIAREEPDF
jgi:hypothetical protein